MTGTVAEVYNFGVFVHIDGEPNGLCTGFIRVPDLTWGWINHPSETVEADQRITAEVIITDTLRTGHALVEGSAEGPTHPVCGSGRLRSHRADQDRSI
ncbi:S1 RNA-binding domain-containing protein [Streptomyces sp. NPDC014864]|uniref:S1 RNA-binding domain-containing protein n=1 Tax=Streptomyces sp. NPDC014864 TaxID=3364924 RepID=UPI0036F97457